MPGEMRTRGAVRPDGGSLPAFSVMIAANAEIRSITSKSQPGVGRR